MLPQVHGHRKRYRGNPIKIQAILYMKVKSKVNEIQRLTGRIAVLSRFISKSSKKSLPFFNVLRKAKSFKWGSECQSSFNEFKKYLEGFLLVNPSLGDTLYFYISITSQIVSSVLLREKGGQQNPYTMSAKYSIGLRVVTPTSKKIGLSFNHHRSKGSTIFSFLPQGDMDKLSIETNP
ncbi:UNVERIFIED_CONTAM: hypothetical protein Scaly_1805200 [Sesamum calycinum]|uniref:Reverse transcriptase/retrotransposon-derived protein RNase H-like domain-containing protein n=1 Tax=Sesamum calycinum TaxID=2727403 RepID=A0AAW2NYA9_9LAMI